jgi:hypothetical protein
MLGVPTAGLRAMVMPGAELPSITIGAVIASAEYPLSVLSPMVVRSIVCPPREGSNLIVSTAEPEKLSAFAMAIVSRSEPGPESFRFVTV